MLNIRINLNVQNGNISEILKDIEQQGNFFFAYNPDNINESRKVSLSVQNIKVEDALKKLFQNQVTFRQVENHIIINEVSKSSTQSNFQISGRIADDTNAPLDSVIVYDPENEQLVISQGDGSFSFDFNTNNKNIGLYVSRPFYNDTVIYVGSGSQNIQLSLYKRESPFAMIPKGTEAAEFRLKEKKFESLSLVRKFVPSEAIYASHLNTEKVMPVQLSFLPKVGTNSFVKGLRVNNVSLNMLAGYSKGLKGAEFGGIANIIQKEAKGFQAAGVANIVLGDVHGIQFSGVYTNDFSNVSGFQVSGVYNTLQGNIRGGQISGVFNMAYKNINGTQTGGVLNIAKEKLVGAQISGVLNMNYDEVSGAQIAGLANISENTVKGLQLAGAYNESVSTNGAQISGTINQNKADLKGVQITALMNKTKTLHGLQFGLINVADTIHSGFQIGLINIVKHGNYSLDFLHSESFPVEVNLKTGNPKFYSIINVVAGNEKIGFGYGFGRNFAIKNKIGISSDIISTSINDSQKFTFQGTKLSMRMALNYQLFNHLKLTGGVSGNYFIPEDINDTTAKELSESNNYINKALQNGKNNFWAGWFLGIQLSNQH
ncbi:STN domain-containing protein [Maribellus maritimus]|uniref:STN domain-containing protein n=1 Tax=Maribellus maritimus TaxID=2870838 RepID=UPI001EEC0E1E|nr:STN domain-containing protein [Maribellus maritimus]MCG6191022.1 STN domain-containing protein [Maribellus maritimus]